MITGINLGPPYTMGTVSHWLPNDFKVLDLRMLQVGTTIDAYLIYSYEKMEGQTVHFRWYMLGDSIPTDSEYMGNVDNFGQILILVKLKL